LVLKFESAVAVWPMYGVPEPFSDDYHGHGNVPVTVEGPLNVVRRFISGYLKTIMVIDA